MVGKAFRAYSRNKSIQAKSSDLSIWGHVGLLNSQIGPIFRLQFTFVYSLRVILNFIRFMKNVILRSEFLGKL